MAKRYIKTQTVTVSRQEEVLVEDVSSKTSKLALLQELAGDIYHWCKNTIVNTKKGSKDGDSNH